MEVLSWPWGRVGTWLKEVGASVAPESWPALSRGLAACCGVRLGTSDLSMQPGMSGWKESAAQGCFGAMFSATVSSNRSYAPAMGCLQGLPTTRFLVACRSGAT